MKELWEYLPNTFCDKQKGYPNMYGTLNGKLEESLACIISYIASGLDFLGIERDVLHVYYQNCESISGDNETDFLSLKIDTDSSCAELIVTNIFIGIGTFDNEVNQIRYKYLGEKDPFQQIDIKLRTLYQTLFYSNSPKIYKRDNVFTSKKYKEGKLYIRNLSLDGCEWISEENTEEREKDKLAYSYQLRTIRFMYNDVPKHYNEYNKLSTFDRTLKLLKKKDRIKIIVSNESFNDIFSFNEDKLKEVISDDVDFFIMDSNYNTCIQMHYSHVYNQMFNPIHFSFDGELSLSRLEDAEFVAKNHILFVLDMIKESDTDMVVLAGAGGLFDRLFFREASKFFVQNGIKVKLITFDPIENIYPAQNRLYYNTTIPDIIKSIGEENVIIEHVDISRLKNKTMLSFRQELVSMMADDICKIIKETTDS